MDYLSVFLVPFRPASLIMVGAFSLLMSFFLWAASLLGIMGMLASLGLVVLNVWVLKYCFVLIERIADGATEPPVMDMDMLSTFERRPWSQAALLVASAMLCWRIGGNAGIALGVLFILLIPAQTALIAMGENLFQAMNPLAWLRVIRGLGAWYLVLLAALAVVAGMAALLIELELWTLIEVAIFLLCELGFFGLIGSCIWLRRGPLGFEPSHSPERAAAREESERVKLRARMLDEVFEQARIGKYVNATAPLANWLKDADSEYAVRDSLHVAEQALKWQLLPALNPIGSTLIRHLLRFGRPDAALSVFEMFRRRTAQFTMDSAHDLRTLAEYADGVGKEELARSMRLETPIVGPPA
jgi:hypothetical protein